MSMKWRIIVVVITEVVYILVTRLALYYYGEPVTELIRTFLRIVAIFIYLGLLKSLIRSKKPNLTALLKPSFIVGMLLLSSIPVFFVTGVQFYYLIGTIFYATEGIIAGIREELFYRGIIQNLFNKKYGPFKSVLFVGVLFTAMHIGVVPATILAYIHIFLCGIILGIIYERSGSIMTAIAVHAANNVLFSFSPIIKVSTNYYWVYWGLIPLFISTALVLYWAGYLRRQVGR